MPRTVPTTPPLRKAAILVSTLDRASAEALLAKMPPETADIVRQMVEQLDDVVAGEQEAVIREFMVAGGLQPERDDDGVELELSRDYDSPSDPGYLPPAVENAPPFGFLREATADVLARHLERQHPQVIAVVTAHLPPQQAAEIVKRLPSRLQCEVLRRIAELDLTDQEVLRDIERELEALLSDDLRLARRRQSGLAAVSTILNAAGSQRGQLLDNLSQHEQELATQLTGRSATPARRARQAAEPAPRTAVRAPLRAPAPTSGLASRPSRSSSVPAATSARGPTAAAPAVPAPADHEPLREPAIPSGTGGTSGVSSAPPRSAEPVASAIEFEELSQLGEDDWAALLRAAEPPIMLLALTGASEELLRRITQGLPRRDAQALHQRLQQTGPVRLSDIEQAQRNIAVLASRLAADGTIQLPVRRGFAAAA